MTAVGYELLAIGCRFPFRAYSSQPIAAQATHNIEEETMTDSNLRWLWLLIFAAVVACPAAAQNFPARTVRIIVPYAPGGSTDVVFRILAPRLAEDLGQQVVVDNRPGGSSTIGLDLAAKSPPDGHTDRKSVVEGKR